MINAFRDALLRRPPIRRARAGADGSRSRGVAAGAGETRRAAPAADGADAKAQHGLALVKRAHGPGEAFDPARLIEGTADALRPMAAQHGVELRVFIDPAVSGQRLGDAQRLRHIVTELVGNAIRFSSGLDRRGRVELRVELQPQALTTARDGGDDAVSISVADNGIGMSPDIVQRLFRPFIQPASDAAGAPAAARARLGLVVSSRLAATMGGHLGVRSVAGAGSQFDLTLPLPAVRAEMPWPGRALLAGVICHLALGDAALAADWRSYLMAAGARVRPLADAEGVTPLSGRAGHVLVCDAQRLPVDWTMAQIADGSPPFPTVRVQHGGRGRVRLMAPGLVTIETEGLRRGLRFGASQRQFHCVQQRVAARTASSSRTPRPARELAYA
jgi:two-component sensor histidine kinase